MKTFRNLLVNFFSLPLIDFFVGLGLLFIDASNTYLNKELYNIANILNIEVNQNYRLLSRVTIIFSASYLILSSIVKTVQSLKKKESDDYV